MTSAQIANFLSALLGACGTITVYVGSYSLPPLEGSVFNSPEVSEYNRHTMIKRQKILIMQRVGLALICLSFLIQALAVFLPNCPSAR